MKFGIYTNIARDTNAKNCKKLANILDKKEIEYMICENASEFFDCTKCLPIDELAKFCDIMLVFGGDGTMLYVANFTARHLKPLLGINIGHVGFLTEIDIDQLEISIERLINQNYEIEKRSMIDVIFKQNGQIIKNLALNEAILCSRDNCHICNIEVYIDGLLADKVRGDGTIVSTPTGSTAYSLSCNGSILDPKIKGIIINTICPHSLHSCPMVISDDREVVLKCNNLNMNLIVDGRIIKTFESPQEILLKKSQTMADFIRLSGKNFYQKLTKKLRYWEE